MLLCQSGAERAHDVVQSGLMAGNAIGVPFDDDCGLRIPDGVAGMAQTVDQSTLMEDGAFGGVEVLGLVAVGTG